MRQDGTGDCTTIQACVDSAAAGDSVLVYPGVYAEHIVATRAICLISLSGSAGTVIDGTLSGRCVLFDGIPSPGVVFKGFTVRNGEIQTWPTSFFNSAGGGVFFKGSMGHVSECILEHNAGGGIACDDTSTVIIEHNLFQEGYPTYIEPLPVAGAGVITRSSNTVISENTFLNNIDSDVVVLDCSPQVVKNRLLGTSGYGGIIGAANAYIAENLIVNCYEGALLYGWCTFTLNTVVNNRWAGVRVGIGTGPQSPNISNNIITGSPLGFECSGGFPVFSCNDLWNNGDDYFWSCWGSDTTSNFHADPEFCDEASGDYTLSCTSPCAERPGCGRVGAFGVACGATAVQETTWGRIKTLFR